MKMEIIKKESKTYQYRKVTKPLLERKRRARINKCLDNLKDLMIDCMRQQGDNIARLEKADILELTVEHLRKIKKTSTTMRINNNDSFRSGYVHAANEVSRALASFSRVDIELGTKLMTHLGHRLNQIQIQQQQSEIIIKKSITDDTVPTRGLLPLSVYCDNIGDNFNHSTRKMMISPSLSSGYGSDSDCSLSLPSSPNQHLQIAVDVWRPW